jgi:hypothetical protein
MSNYHFTNSVEENGFGNLHLRMIYGSLTPDFSRKTACRKWTWVAPDRMHTNMTDLMLEDRKWKTAVHVCRTFQETDISDHSLVGDVQTEVKTE